MAWHSSGLVSNFSSDSTHEMLTEFIQNSASSRLPLRMNVRMNAHRRITNMADCSFRPRMRAALTPSGRFKFMAVCILASPLTGRHGFSLSAARSPQKVEKKVLRRLSGPRLAHIIPGSRNRWTSHQGPRSTSSFDRPADEALREPTSTPQANLTVEAPAQEGSSVRTPTTNPKFLLLKLFEDLVPRGLLPRVTSEPPSSSLADYESTWTVTISLRELGIDVKGRGSTFLFAETAAAIRFDLALNRTEIVAKMASWPQTQMSLADATNIVQSYWQFAHDSREALKRIVTKLDSGAFEACTFAGSNQIGEPVTSAVKDTARGIQDLTLAHNIVSGHPNLWPMSPENPFQAKIVLDHARLKKLRHLISAATDYLRTTPGKQHGTFDKAIQEGSENDTINLQGDSSDAPRLDIRDLKSRLGTLPFQPSISKMLVVGASLHCLEHAIILAAMEKHAVYRKTTGRSKEDGSYRNPAFRNVTSGDHPDLLFLFQRLRDAKWVAKTQRPILKSEDPEEKCSKEDVTPNTHDPVLDHQGCKVPVNSFSESEETSSAQNVTLARRFDHYDPDGIASVSVSAGAIERSMITAGLVSYQKDTSYISVPESELKIRAEPYGGDLSRTTHRRNILRHLLVLGFSENIAQIGHGTLAPGRPPQLRIDSQDVYIDSPLKTHMPQKQLYKTMRAGPIMVVTGMTDNPQGSCLSARYCTPISTWEAVLLVRDLTLPDHKETPVAGASQVLVNNWLPVLVRSEIDGVSHEEARDMLLKARKALHRAIDKAMFDYVNYSWHSFKFYDLLTGLLPNEDSFAAMAVPKEQRDRPRPRRNQPSHEDK